jgi:hypothetical protein
MTAVLKKNNCHYLANNRFSVEICENCKLQEKKSFISARMQNAEVDAFLLDSLNFFY